MEQPVSEEQLRSILQKKFGFENFRPGQQEAISQLLSKGSLLCIQPTGHGKSLLYQLPATILDGMTLVISPLLALMRDQEEHLNQRFSIPAASLNSDQSEEENNQVRTLVCQGAIKILFVAPEQLDHVDRFDFLLNLPVKLIVVDEAHCISTWGHDFRPSYRQILQFVHALMNKDKSVRVLGLTATADRTTEGDIKEQLSLPGRPLEVMRETMDRPNIKLSAFQLSTTAQKLYACEQLLSQIEGAGLIYCATRENTELVSNYLKSRHIDAAAYHAGFPSEDKRRLQKEFINDKFKVLAATNALGMGIDKSNLRFIIHFDIPGSITAYYQEVGRCGRDGLEAFGILLYDPADKRIQRYFIESSQPTVADFQNVLSTVKGAIVPPNLNTIKCQSGLHPTRVIVIIAELIEQGFISKASQKGTQVYCSTGKSGDCDLSRYTQQYDVKLRELENMLHYSEQKKYCRMKILRRSLGDLTKEACGRCSACTESSLKLIEDPSVVSKVNAWLDMRMIQIPLSKRNNISAGHALMDGRVRSSMFVNFMTKRAESKIMDEALSQDFRTLLKRILDHLLDEHKIAAVVPVPSRTWGIRDELAAYVAKQLHCPLLLDFLKWNEEPESRQGFLLNNDQRRKNVNQKMSVNGEKSLSSGTIILLDDYMGSGSTLKEAARALRKEAKLENEIVPVTMAFVKWKLGKPGMV
ncbi:MAG: ATP-dependent DNA helicase RecQ [Chlamydiales bacterium]|jgi:ATP-dependent DNA helicase RecQ